NRPVDARPRRARDDRLAGLSIRTPRAMRAPQQYEDCSPRERDLEVAVDPPQTPGWQAWLEIAVLAALVTTARLAFGLGLPWLALAPLLAGVRYGSCLGVPRAGVGGAALSGAAHSKGAVHAPPRPPLPPWLLA